MSDLRFKPFYKNTFNWQESEFLRNTRSHPLVAENLFEDRKITKTQQEEWFNEIYSKNLNFQIVIAYDEEISAPVGYIQFHIDSLIHRRCEVGYVVHPEFWGKGYGSALVHWSTIHITTWEETIHRVWLTVFPENKRAIEIYKEFGFKIDGIFKKYVYKDKKYRDVCFMFKFIKT